VLGNQIGRYFIIEPVGLEALHFGQRGRYRGI
jgi:hypothetical protein